MAKGRTKKTPKDIPQAVRELCLMFPEAEEIQSHGSPNFKITDGRIFATLAINHHGDGYLALWLPMPSGAQSMYVDGEPEYFYVPPYVGPNGWLGVMLDQGLSWDRIAELVREAYLHIAPKRLSRDLGPAPSIEPPTVTIDPVVFDPFSSKTAQRTLDRLRSICLKLPEVSEQKQFGNPCFKAGKKNFATLYFRDGQLKLSTWVGADEQPILTFDERYQVPAYTGHNGWIELDLHKPALRGEIEGLIDKSYRHFALRRMLKELEEQ